MLDLAFLHPLLAAIAAVGILFILTDTRAAQQGKPILVPVRNRIKQKHF